ncbi:pyocin S6 family toxin immunity protein [Pseudomonas mohnii]|uniref:pyocin S6 family toxin immunity protein n=1 Tax=Pseudomonas mohnii TaxID=395600 RepID=UPI0018C4E280|nr:pyocin S6 family toxin immunity protein [Pseudomonas mohnii]MBH8614851.1 hypothetical protein [Pseudomonas mohnii]
MYLCISGFLSDSPEDDSLKFVLDLDNSFSEEIIKSLDHRSLNAMVETKWLLASEQFAQKSKIVGQSLPTHLKLFIGVEA